MNRRSFLSRSLAAGGVSALPVLLRTPAQAAAKPADAGATELIDTHVHLFDWPFRKLKYSQTGALVAKLRKHGVTQAWAGSFEALLHKNVNGVNLRLAEECRRNGAGMLLPFGTVNPAWPDWEEDLRRCHEVYQMPGIRLYPTYQGYGIDHPNFVPFLQAAGDRGLLVQIVLGLEDSRVHHPITVMRKIPSATLTAALKQVPKTKVQLLYAAGETLPPPARTALAAETQARFDISRFDSVGVLWRMLGGGEKFGDGDFDTSRVPLERIVFGSHAPYFPLETALIRLFESPLSLPQMQAIMHGNARQLLARA